jgi:putative endonuclease
LCAVGASDAPPFLYPLDKKMKNQFFYIYILFSHKDNGLYIGYTENLKIRLGEHFKGRVIATKNRKPLLLIHYEAFTNRKDAKAREEFLKSGFGRSQMKKALQNRFEGLGHQQL